MKNSRFIKIIKQFSNFIVFFVVMIVLALSVRGLPGNPDSVVLNTNKWKGTGPLELSPERGRYALTYSIVEDKSVHFSVSLARFITPDLGYWNDKYVSLFAPTVSVLIIPGYILGKTVGLAQVGSFAVIALFAAGNFYLIGKIAELLGANKFAAKIGGLIFVFATPAFAYAVTLYQHHISTFIILLSTYLLIKFPKKVWSLFAIFFLIALSISVDNPNLFLIFPIGLAAAVQFIDLFTITKDYKADTIIALKPLRLLSAMGVIIPLVLFGYFNFISYESPFRLAGTVQSVEDIDKNGKPLEKRISSEVTEEEIIEEAESKSAVNFFQTRNIRNGLFIHLFSPDRGIIVYTPIVLIGIIGIVLVYKRTNPYLQLLLAVASINLLLYSMWGDPWGGWAFGSRYLIPAYSIMAIFSAIAISKYGKYILFNLLLALLLIYSVGVNTVGALSTNKLPPQVEIASLEYLSGRKERYSFDRGVEFLLSGNSKSFVYQAYASKYLNTTEYYVLVYSVIIATGLTLIVLNIKFVKEENEKNR